MIQEVGGSGALICWGLPRTYLPDSFVGKSNGVGQLGGAWGQFQDVLMEKRSTEDPPMSPLAVSQLMRDQRHPQLSNSVPSRRA